MGIQLHTRDMSSPNIIIFCLFCVVTKCDDLYDVYPCYPGTSYPPTGYVSPDHGTTHQVNPTTWNPEDPWEIELVGGSGPHQGNVVVTHGNSKVLILSCDNPYGYCTEESSNPTWNCADAEVVCHQLGYVGAESFSMGWSTYGGVENYEVLFKGVECEGWESNLSECKYTMINSDFDRRIAGVSCIAELVPTTDVDTTTTTWTTEASEGPDGWIDVADMGCFYIPANFSVDNWWEANLVCEELGGHMLEPKNIDIQDFFSSLLGMLPDCVAGGANWWIGLTDTGHEGMWEWVHEAEFAEEQFWADGHPETGAGNDADCAMMVRWKEYFWVDVSCFNYEPDGNRTSVICQK